jgi:hypothetical protein
MIVDASSADEQDLRFLRGPEASNKLYKLEVASTSPPIGRLAAQ